MIELLCYILAFCFEPVVLGEVDYASSLVFDPLYYVNHNADLHGITTREKARNHWLTEGINQGRQAIGSFHSKQYLARYSDISRALGNNYTQAVHHYILHHAAEKRLGIVEGSFQGKWTISSNGIVIGASARMGGAIDSITWNGREFINSYDHGRELQMACNSDTYIECYNPTEAGGRDDSYHDSTHTHIDWVKANGNVLESQVHPAFWLKPGTRETINTHVNGCTRGSHALNRQATYSEPFHKKVTIGTHGVSNCVEYLSNFTLGGNWPNDLQYIQMEAPTGYMSGDFVRLYSFDPHKTLVQIHKGNSLPVVMSTQDNTYAIGVYSPPGQDTDARMYYGSHMFHFNNFASSTSKWSVVFRKRRFSGIGPVSQVYKSYICIGTLDMVSVCLHKIIQKVNQ